MRGFLEDQRGVSAIIGFVLVIALVIMALAAYLTQQVPEDWEAAEWATMQEVKSSFLELRDEVQGLGAGDVGVVKVRMGTPSPTAMLSATTSATMEVVSSRSVDPNYLDAGAMYYYNTYRDDYFSTLESRNVYRGYDTYVDQDPAYQTQNYTSPTYDNLHLYVSTTQDNLKRTYLKFDLSDSYLYNGSDYVFYDDAVIHEAKLFLYIDDADLVEEPGELMQALAPLIVEVWGVENDAWDEGITWQNQPHNPAVDVKLENADVDDEGAWIAWDVTSFVKTEWEKIKGRATWFQTKWQENEGTPAFDIGEFSSGYWKFDDYYDIEFYEPDEGVWYDTPGENRGFTIRGTSADARIWSSVFDTGDNNACWNYVSWSASDVENTTVWVRFDNDAGFASPTDWENVIDGENSYAYLENYGRYAQYSVSLDSDDYFYNIIFQYTYFVSFVLREPEATGTSSLQNLATFRSRDSTTTSEHWEGGHKYYPRLQLVYSRQARPGKAGVGLADFGYIEYRANNEYFPSQYYIYEGGMVIIQKDPGWYETVLADPPGFVTFSEADGNNIRLAVKRYQIEEGSVHGESAGGTGYTSVRVQREGVENLVSGTATPNRSEVTITIRTDHPSAWRDYLERLAAKLNYQMGGEWDQYGDYVLYDYDSVSLRIYGKDLDPEVQDIYYTEQVIWIDATLGSFAGGRT